MVDIFIKNKNNSKEGEYVGRPTALGNPFKITSTQSRQVVIEKYSKWLKEEIKNNNSEIIEALDNLFSILINKQNLTLICHCSPKPCHANVIKQILLDKYHTGSFLI